MMIDYEGGENWYVDQFNGDILWRNTSRWKWLSGKVSSGEGRREEVLLCFLISETNLEKGDI